MPPKRSNSKKEELYEYCMRQPPGKIFYQEELLGAGIVHRESDLQELCQDLVGEQLFEQLIDEGLACWKGRTREDAQKYACHSASNCVEKATCLC